MNDRGTGKTTKQMREAKLNAVFVWCNDNLYYPKLLAKSLNRTDLKIQGLSDLEFPAHIFEGVKIPEVIIDHAALLSEKHDIGRQFLRIGVKRYYE